MFCYRKRNTVDILEREKECVRIIVCLKKNYLKNNFVFCYRKRNTVDILDRDKECVRIDTAHRERLIAALLTPQTFKNKWSGLPGMSVGYVCFLFIFYCYCFFFVSLERVERNECGVCLFFTKNKFLTKKKYLFIARFCRTSGLGCQAYMWGIFIFLFFYCFFFSFL